MWSLQFIQRANECLVEKGELEMNIDSSSGEDTTGKIFVNNNNS
jgi:hypothetical protein